MGRGGRESMERSSPRRLARFLSHLSKQTGIARILLLHNVGNQWMKLQIQQEVEPIELIFLDDITLENERLQSALSNFHYRMIIEQILATQAEVFVASGFSFRDCSTVSRIVAEERLLSGRSVKSTLYLFSEQDRLGL